MRRTAIATTALAMALLPAASASGDYQSTYDQYGTVRQDLHECDLDTNWGQMSADSDCNTLFARYELFVPPDDASALYIHCRSASQCLDTPDGMPSAAGPIPDGSKVYDVQPAAAPKPHSKAKAARHRHRRHH
jgi:hypothetical protein